MQRRPACSFPTQSGTLPCWAARAWSTVAMHQCVPVCTCSIEQMLEDSGDACRVARAFVHCASNSAGSAGTHDGAQPTCASLTGGTFQKG